MGATLIIDIALNGWTQPSRSDSRLTKDRGKMRLDLVGGHTEAKCSISNWSTSRNRNWVGTAILESGLPFSIILSTEIER
jgi:hypothetical protein